MWRGGFQAGKGAPLNVILQVVAAVLGGLVMYASHVMVREDTKMAKGVKRLCRSTLRHALRLPRMVHVMTDELMLALGMMTTDTARVRQGVSAVVQMMKGPKHMNAYKGLIAVISKADGTLGSWQRRMLDSDIYAEVKRDLKGEGIGKAKPATLKRLIRIAANRKQARDIEGLKTKRGRGDYARMREILLDRPISLLSTSPGYMRLGILRWAEQEIMRAGFRRYSKTLDDMWCTLCRTEMF